MARFIGLDFDEKSVAFRKQSFTLLIFATRLSIVNTLLSSLCGNSDVASLLFVIIIRYYSIILLFYSSDFLSALYAIHDDL